jgi:hypothetical protein
MNIKQLTKALALLQKQKEVMQQELNALGKNVSDCLIDVDNLDDKFDTHCSNYIHELKPEKKKDEESKGITYYKNMILIELYLVSSYSKLRFKILKFVAKRMGYTINNVFIDAFIEKIDREERTI